MAGRTSAQHHVVAIDYGVKRNILRLLAEGRLQGHGRAGDGERRGGAGARARRRLPVERPGRPGRDRRIRRAGDPAAARGAGADLRHLPRPPDARPRRRRAHQEDAPGPSRREPPGQGHDDRQGRDHLDEPRLRGRSGEPAARPRCRPMSRSSTARTAASRSPTGRPSRCSTTPRPRPGRATATTSSTASSR